MTCGAADVSANGFNIWASDGQGGNVCYTNVHPSKFASV